MLFCQSDPNTSSLSWQWCMNWQNFGNIVPLKQLSAMFFTDQLLALLNIHSRLPCSLCELPFSFLSFLPLTIAPVSVCLLSTDGIMAKHDLLQLFGQPCSHRPMPGWCHETKFHVATCSLFQRKSAICLDWAHALGKNDGILTMVTISSSTNLTWDCQ